MSELAIVTEQELSLVDDNRLNKSQLQHILKQTPQKYIKSRPAKGGGQWQYVTGGYIRKVLNLMFGFDWDFEVIESKIEYGEVIVLGKLKCRTSGHEIIKMQYGNKEIVYKKAKQGEERKPLSIGNDMKAATTDALKKCAAEIGIAADIYNSEDFNPVQIIDTPTLEKIQELFEKIEDKILGETSLDIQRVIDNKEETSYNKVYKYLKSIK